MYQRDEIIGKAVAMVNGFREFRRVTDQGEWVSEELDLRVSGYIKDFRLIGEAAIFFDGYAGADRLLNAVHCAGGDLLTAKMMLEGIAD
jgi:hypothetical protein